MSWCATVPVWVDAVLAAEGLPAARSVWGTGVVLAAEGQPARSLWGTGVELGGPACSSGEYTLHAGA
eukprot:3940904-Amphidinium_carterae.1